MLRCLVFFFAFHSPIIYFLNIVVQQWTQPCPLNFGSKIGCTWSGSWEVIDLALIFFADVHKKRGIRLALELLIKQENGRAPFPNPYKIYQAGGRQAVARSHPVTQKAIEGCIF